MPGYQLVERAALSLAKPNGIAALPNEIGILDLLRDLEDDTFPYSRLYELRVIGLEDVLYAARPDDALLALEIKRRLRMSAQDLQNRMISVQIVFNGRLIHGDDLWVEYRNQRLPIGHIFGSPP